MTDIHSFTGCYIDEQMHFICQNKRVLMIDAVFNDAAFKMLQEIDPSDILIILTHEHFDHIYGINFYRKNFNCRVMCSKKCGLKLGSSRKNLAMFSEVIIEGKSDKPFDTKYTCYADETFEDEVRIEWEGHTIYLKETPGHSDGSICIEVDTDILFSGDSLIKDNKVITTLPTGDKTAYKEITEPYLKSFSDKVMVYPGHGTSGCISDFF